jgi:AcrR family transcriptional regulator
MFLNIAEPGSGSVGRVTEDWRPQREAAARNETAILTAARRLLRSSAPGRVDVRDIARGAGVGVGTVYRHFTDKATLLAAVVGDDERTLQDAILSGPPPLGPGAPPGERLRAFLAALAELTDDNLNILLATDIASGGRLRVGAYSAWRLHVATLLRELDLPQPDAWWLADVLLAPLAADLYALHAREHGMRSDQIVTRLTALADATLCQTARRRHRKGRNAPRSRAD